MFGDLDRLARLDRIKRFGETLKIWLNPAPQRTVNQKGSIVAGDLVGGSRKSTISVGGRFFTGNDLNIVGGRMYVDGKDVTDESGVDFNVLEIRVVEGTIHNLRTDKSVTVINGSITGNVAAGGSVTCDDIGGNVDSTGSITCDNIGGSAKAGGSVTCDEIRGDVQANGSVIADVINGRKV